MELNTSLNSFKKVKLSRANKSDVINKCNNDFIL